jgi:acid phosphatase
MVAVSLQVKSPAQAAGVPALDHVFIIVMENQPYGSIIGSSAAPYANSLVTTGGLATSYAGVSHPSLPNYLALTGASTYGIASDCTTCWVSASNIADTLESNGSTWKAYMESMPSPCFVGDSYPYMQKHDPFIYFNDIRTNTSRCQSHVVPYSQLSTDLQSTSSTPNYAFITPNMCNDTHDCVVATGDAWLQQQVPIILSSPAFKTQRSLLAITWDEDDGSAGNHVPLILVGSGVGAGLASAVSYNHYSLLHTVEVARGLPTLTTNDASAPAITDLFATAPSPSPSPSATNPCTSATLNVNPTSTAISGASPVLTAGSAGCTAPTYQFWTLAPGSSTWSVAQAYSTGATFQWNTAGLTAGVYRLSVWARDATSAGTSSSGLGSYDAYAPGQAYTLTVTPCTAIGASASLASPQAAGAAITVTGSASGCPNPRYEFWVMAPGGGWTILQGYSSAATFSWNTTPPAGTYRYSVWVRDAGSPAAYDTFFPGIRYTLTTTPCTLVTASAALTSPQAAGTDLTITASASGCTNPRYEFWIAAPGSSWTIAQTYSSSSAFIWKTTGLPAGTYRYSVWVHDASSGAGYDTYFPGTPFALT